MPKTITFRTNGTLKDPDHIWWFDSPTNGSQIYESRSVRSIIEQFWAECEEMEK